MKPRGLAVGLVLAATVTAGACGSSGSSSSAGTTSGASSGESARQAAAGVCSVLVDFDNAVAEHVNAASGEIHLDTDPAHARALLLTATEQVQAAADQLPDDYAALGLTSEGDIGRLVADASAATGPISEQLDLITADLNGELRTEGPRDMLSAVFIKMEKVQSLAQPEIDDYHDDALVDALDGEPDCEHTISH